MIVRAGAGAEPGLQLASPRDGAERGSQVSFSHPHGYAIMQALIHEGVIGDFRAPDIIRYATASPASCIQPAGLSGVCVARRFGFTPLYTQFADVWKAVDVLHGILSSGSWDTPQVKSPISPLYFADSPPFLAILCQLSAILTSNSCGQMRKRQRVT